MRKLYRERHRAAGPLKGLDDSPSRAMSEAQNLTHLPAAPCCEICVQARGKSDWHTRVKYQSEIPCAQIYFQFISGVAVWCPKAHAKAAVNFVVRSTDSFVD